MAEDQDQTPVQASDADYDFAHSMAMGVPISGGPSPYEKFLEQSPQFAHVPKERVLQGLHKELAPDLEYERFQQLAQMPNGYAAIQKAKANLTDVEKFRIQFPQFKDIPRERITDAMYKKAVSEKKVDPTMLSPEEYRHKVDPIPGPMNDLWNLWEGIKTSSSMEFHKEESMATGGYDKWLMNSFTKLMDSTAINVDAKTGKVSIGQGNIGQELNKLHEKIGKWEKTNFPTYFQLVNKFDEILAHVGLTDTEQDKRAAVDQARTGQWNDDYAKVGAILGQTGTGLVLNIPIMGALQKGFKAATAAEKLAAPLDEGLQAIAMRKKAAAIFATTYGGTRAYKEGVEAHHENAFLEGILGGASTAGLGVMFNTGYGRVLSGLNQAIIDAGPSNLQKLINGEPTDASQFASQVFLDVSLGSLFAGHVHTGLKEVPSGIGFTETGVRPGGEPISLEFAEKGHRPLKQSEVLSQDPWALLGGAVEGYPNKVSARSPLRITERTERPVEAVGAESGLVNEGLAGPNVLIRGKPLTRQIPIQGEGGTKLVTHRVAAGISDIPELLSQKQVQLEEMIEEPSLLQSDERRVKRVQGIRPGMESQRIYSPEVWEELIKAKDARDNGDIPKAQEHHDTAISLMPPEQAKAHGEDVLQHLKGESQLWRPAPEGEEEPEEWTAFDQAEGIVPHKIVERTPGGVRVRRGEMGSVINPAELILHAAKKVEHLFDDYWDAMRNPLNREQAAASIRKPTAEFETDQHIREQLAVHQATSPWSSQSITRRNRWNAFNPSEQKDILIENSKGNYTPRVSDPKKQSWVNYRLRRDQQILRGAEAAMQRFQVSPKDWYVRSMLVDALGNVKRFDNWVTVWMAEHGGAMPTMEDAIRSKLFWFKSYNLEDWQQAKLNQARNIIYRQDVFDTFQGNGRAIPIKDVQGAGAAPGQGELLPTPNFKKILQKHGWQVHTSPNGTKYLVEPQTWHVMSRVFDQQSLYQVPGVKYLQALAMMAKSVTGNLLSLNLVHPKHIWEISAAHAWTQKQLGVPVSKAWRAMTPAPPGDKALAYIQQRIGRDQMTPEDWYWKDIYDRTGVGLGMNAERRSQLGFARYASDFLGRGHAIFHGAEKALDFLGVKILQGELYQKAIFGHWIPLMKAQGVRLSVERLLLQHPEFRQDHNKVEFDRQLAQIGNDIDNRFGERNMANLLWPRIAKEAGVSTLLSLGWTLGFINVTGGAFKDYSTVAFRMQNIAKNVNDPTRRPVITENMRFFANYATTWAIASAIASFFYGWSRGKKFDPKDIAYPVIGEDFNYATDDPHHWTRGRPVEWPTELLTLYEHIERQGGLLDWHGLTYGPGEFFLNKENPGIKTLQDAFILQHDFYGQDIGGRPTDDQWKRLHDKIAYVLYNDSTPIVIKQVIEARAGHPAPTSLPELVTNVTSPDIIPAILGMPRAPEHVYRSPFENAVVNAYSYGKNTVRTQDMIERSNWENEYRLAVKNKNHVRADEALKILEDKFKVSRGQVKLMTKEGLRGESAAMYMFFHGNFTLEDQKKLLQKATPEEKADWLKRATKGERRVLASLGVQ